jgi:hypothetical protein
VMAKTSRARRARFAMTALLLLAVAGACSTSSQPPQLGYCVPVDGGTCTVTSSGGGSSGAEGGGSCAGYSDATACDACTGSSCCSQLTACSNSTVCINLYNCETACAGAPACISSCQSQYPTGVSTLNLLFDCLTDHCPVCAEAGIGDPCSPVVPGYYPCEPNLQLTCSGEGWCTKTCVHSSDCAGLGTGGVNDIGEPNYCMILSNGYYCAPGCGGLPTACEYFPGTYCLTGTTSADSPAQTVDVCWPLADAAVPKD